MARLEAGVPKETSFFDKIKDVANQVKDFFGGGGAGQTPVKPNVGSQATMPNRSTQVDPRSSSVTMSANYDEEGEPIS